MTANSQSYDRGFRNVSSVTLAALQANQAVGGWQQAPAAGQAATVQVNLNAGR